MKESRTSIACLLNPSADADLDPSHWILYGYSSKKGGLIQVEQLRTKRITMAPRELAIPTAAASAAATLGGGSSALSISGGPVRCGELAPPAATLWGGGSSALSTSGGPVRCGELASPAATLGGGSSSLASSGGPVRCNNADNADNADNSPRSSLTTKRPPLFTYAPMSLTDDPATEMSSPSAPLTNMRKRKLDNR